MSTSDEPPSRDPVDPVAPASPVAPAAPTPQPGGEAGTTPSGGEDRAALTGGEAGPAPSGGEDRAAPVALPGSESGAAPTAPATPDPRSRPAALPGPLAGALVFLSSGAVLVLEVVGLRLIGPYVGVTLQTSSSVIALALAAIAYGAWVGGWLADRFDPRRLLAPALLLAAVATSVTLPVVRYAGELLRGDSPGSILLLTALTVFVPAALLSAMPPLVVTLQLGDLHRTGRVVGRLSGIGTLGGITATLGTGFVLVAALPSSVIVLGLAGLLAAAGLGLGGCLRLTGRSRSGRSRFGRPRPADERPAGRPRSAGPSSAGPSSAGLPRSGWSRAMRPHSAGRRTGRSHSVLPRSARAWCGAAVALLGVAGAGLTVLAPDPCDVETAYHCASVIVDPQRPTGRILVLNSARHSYVDLADPTHLEFAYTRWIGAVADVLAPAGRPVEALHLGGGGFTLPRYLAATRPGSDSLVLELDGALVELDRRELGLRTGPRLRVVVGDARVGLTAQPAASRDLVVGDAFGHLAVPWHLATRELTGQVRRVLRPDGIYALNVIDYPPGRFVRAELATVAAVFPYVALVAPAAALAGRTGSNFVLLGSAAPLPLAALAGRLAAGAGDPVRILDAAGVREFAGSAAVLTDDRAPVDQLLIRL